MRATDLTGMNALAHKPWWQRLYLRAVTQLREEKPVVTTARAAAYARVRDAEQRHDTRDYGRALMQLREATHAELHLSRSIRGVR